MENETNVFIAKLENLHTMLDVLKQYCESQNISSTVIDQIILSVEEALVNIISYAYPEESGTIDMSFEVTANRPGIKITIKDRGIPFNPLENIPPDLPPINRLIERKEEDGVGGYGIYILTCLMDAVDYQRINDENILTLIKYVTRQL